MKKPTHDLTKLPKWAQERIAKAEAEKNQAYTTVSNCHIEQIGIKHDENTRGAIQAVAAAIEANARAAEKLASAISGGHISMPEYGMYFSK